MLSEHVAFKDLSKSLFWIRFISHFSFKVVFGLSDFLSAYSHDIIAVFLSAKTKVKEKS